MAVINQIRNKKKTLLNREDQTFDAQDEENQYYEEKELVQNLDAFDNKIAPSALHLFAENLHLKLKNAMGNKSNTKV